MKKKNLKEEDIVKAVKESRSMIVAAHSLGVQYKTFRSYAQKYGVWSPNQPGKGFTKVKEGKSLEDILSGKTVYTSSHRLRERLIEDGIKEYKCEVCGNKTWNEMPIPLELHHMDGDHLNNALSNILIICPNCHAQTSTYRSKTRNK